MPIPTSPQLVQIMKARNGIAPVVLLDVLTGDGQTFYWGQTAIVAPAALYVSRVLGGPQASYLPYLLNVDKFHFSRSMQADLGTIDVQNLSGDTIVRDTAAALARNSFEGAVFVLREWYPEAEEAGFEMHGRLSVDSITESNATFTCMQLFNASAYETPQYVYSETCQWRYASIPCGADGSNPCQNTFTTCRVPARFFGVLNNFTQVLSPTIAAASTRQVNPSRQF